MVKETVTYKDFDGNERTEDFWFHLSEAELTEWLYEEPGGLKKYIEKMVNEKDMNKIIQTTKKLLVKSYGEKSEDGKRFIKNKDLTDAFVQTQAYSDLFMKLSTDEEAAARFVNNVIPKELAERAAKENASA